MKIRISLCLCLLMLPFTACVSSILSNKGPSRNLAREEQGGERLRNAQETTISGKRGANEPMIKLYPVDEASNDQSFKQFRESLVEAARRRDSKLILAILDPHILNSLGGNGGVKEFREMWMIDEPNSKFWGEFITVLSMGGSFHKNNDEQVFCAPYISSKWETVVGQIPDSSDVSQYAAIVGENINVRRRPDLTSPVIVTLSYDIVKIDYKDSIVNKDQKYKFTWMKITTPDNKEGFVSGESIRSPSDYHACFNKKDGKWIMTMFAAGD